MISKTYYHARQWKSIFSLIDFIAERVHHVVCSHGDIPSSDSSLPVAINHQTCELKVSLDMKQFNLFTHCPHYCWGNLAINTESGSLSLSRSLFLSLAVGMSG